MATDVQVTVQDESRQVVTEAVDVQVVSVDSALMVVVEEQVTQVVSVGEQGPTGAQGPIGLTGPSGGLLTAYVRDTPIPAALGGVVVGTTFNNTMEEVLDQLLYPYQSPAFSSFSFPQATPVEVGATVASGSKVFSWTTTNPSNIEAGTATIADVTTSTVLGTGLSLTSPQSFTISAATHSTATSHTWRVSATNTNAVDFSRDFSVTWLWRTYYGESVLSALAETDVEALRVSGLSSSITGTKLFLGGGYKYVCYPTTFGLRTVFKDTATNLDVAMIPAVTTLITNSNGVAQNYYVHRTLNILGGAISIAIS